jgi:hypothetical protein
LVEVALLVLGLAAFVVAATAVRSDGRVCECCSLSDAYIVDMNRLGFPGNSSTREDATVFIGRFG